MASFHLSSFLSCVRQSIFLSLVMPTSLLSVQSMASGLLVERRSSLLSSCRFGNGSSVNPEATRFQEDIRQLRYELDIIIVWLPIKYWASCVCCGCCLVLRCSISATLAILYNMTTIFEISIRDNAQRYPARYQLPVPVQSVN